MRQKDGFEVLDTQIQCSSYGDISFNYLDLEWSFCVNLIERFTLQVLRIRELYVTGSSVSNIKPCCASICLFQI